MSDVAFAPGWPIDERKYLRLLRRVAKIKDFTIFFPVRMDEAKVAEVLNLTHWGESDLPWQVDNAPEEVAVMCVYLAYQQHSTFHGRRSHPLPKVLSLAHQKAADVLDKRRTLVDEALAQIVEISGDFEFDKEVT